MARKFSNASLIISRVNPGPERSRRYSTAFFVVLLVAVAALSFVILRPFFNAIAWAVVLAIAIRPVWLRIERFTKRRSLAAAVTSTLVAFLVLLPAVLLGAALVGQAAQAASRLVAFLRSQEVSSIADLEKLPGIGRALAWVGENAGVTPEVLRQHSMDAAGKLSGFLASTGGGVVVGFFGAVGTFLLTMILLFFLLRDGEEMAEAVSDLLPLSKDGRRTTMRRLGTMLDSIFKGSLLTALIQGALGGIGWALAGLPSGFLAAAAMAVLSLLPIGGTALVWLPGSAVLALQGRTGAAIFLAVWGAAAVGSVDNFLKPLLIGGGGELTTLVVFLGVFGGLSAFGLLGVFIGPITLAMGQTLLEALRGYSRSETEEAAPSS
jgi:predicted PurR-regulated permease PerM